MKILAFELANFSASAAFVMNGCVVSHETYQDPYAQAATLVNNLKRMVEESGHTFLSLDRALTTLGPGSFTGQRVGLAIAKTLSFAGGIQVQGVSSFNWIAQSFVHDRPHNTSRFMVCLKTGRADHFCQGYEATGVASNAPVCLDDDALLATAHAGTLVVGQIPDTLAQHPNARRVTPTAKDLAFVDERFFQPLEPLYVREASATRLL